MALEKSTVPRIFKNGSETIMDPAPELTATMALKKLAEQRTEFMNSSISGPKYEEGKMVYTIGRSAGVKG